MPVPVPVFSKQPTHTVIKQSGNTKLSKPTVFQNLSCTLPVAPTGPPPSFGTRQEWIESLPTWRRSKPRRIWEDNDRFAEHSGQHNFPQGLTVAANASVIKGARAQACIPPLPTIPQSNHSTTPSHHLTGFVSCAKGSMGPEVDNRVNLYDPFTAGHDSYSRNLYSPLLFDGDSPDAFGASSSPPEPATPFGEFVDRAVAAHGCPSFPTLQPSVSVPGIPCGPQLDFCGPECYQVDPYVQVDQVKEPPAATEIATPSATVSYRRLAEPLSEWVANYVWKACLTNTNVSSAPVTSPPESLANSVHSLLLSTLLQPSAVFLAIWYIVRLPIQFGATGTATEHMAEMRFRLHLFGDPNADVDMEALEADAPFRLILLGFMLANKWLDDHTFSNKTWHSISNVPIHSLNKLESLALEIFSYDLSVTTADWVKWLHHVLGYHASLAPSHQQPISRPSANPHSIVRKTIEELIQASSACARLSGGLQEPVFLGLEERKREKEQAVIESAAVQEIDLDEDGPLREEYLPKRRSTTIGHSRNSSVVKPLADSNRSHGLPSAPVEKLPPPAKWSPAGDEPIIREGNRTGGQYVAVQPPMIAPYVGPVPYGSGFYNWAPNNGPVPGSKPAVLSYAYDHQAQPLAYQPYPFPPALPLTHSRSLSIPYTQDNSHAYNRPRTYSQSRLEYRYSDIRMTTNELAPMPALDASWGAPLDPYAQPAPYYPAFVPYPCPSFLPPWLRN